MKSELTSLSVRWRVEQEQERQFKADLAYRDLKVQRLMETLMDTFISLPDNVKDELAGKINEDGPQEAAQWLSNRVIAGAGLYEDDGVRQ